MKKKIIIALSVVVGVFVIGGLLPAGAFSNFYGMQTVRLYKEFLFYNSTGTQKVALNNNGSLSVAGTAIAKVDSFTMRNWNLTTDSSTTAGVDTCLMVDATVGDVFSVTQYTPAWSSTPDTNVTYHYKVGNNGDTVFVQRTKNTAAADLKSGGLYTIIKVDK